MHSHRLESSFEPTGHPPDTGSDALPDALEHDPVIEDFNAFFERLSSLDSLQWPPDGDDDLPPPRTSNAAPVSPATARTSEQRAVPEARAAGGAASVMPRTRMTVLKSDRDFGAAPPPAHGAGGNGRAGLRDVTRFLKMALVGLILFALGLGAGWAALSLPLHFEEAMPNVTRLMERARGLAGVSTDVAGTVPARPAPAPRLRVVEPGPVAQAAGSAPAPSDTARMARATKPPRAGTATPVPAPAPRTDTVRTAPAIERDIQLPSPQGAPGASVAATDAGDANPASNGADPRFTLQVGACTSFACVENYRRLLLGKVGSQSIKVVTQGAGAGQATVQRIRVQPLERDAAERLKAELTAMDPRFRDAYLIALK
jgi:hypothetical protein